MSARWQCFKVLKHMAAVVAASQSWSLRMWPMHASIVPACKDVGSLRYGHWIVSLAELPMPSIQASQQKTCICLHSLSQCRQRPISRVRLAKEAVGNTELDILPGAVPSLDSVELPDVPLVAFAVLAEGSPLVLLLDF